MRFISFCISGYQFYCTILSTASSISIVFSIYKKRPNFFNFCLFSLALLLFYSCTQSLISLKDISCVYFLFYIVQTTIISVGDNCLALFLKFFQIIDYFASEECCTIFQRWFVDNYRCSFCFDTLHNSLNR